ncbi:hypothetical protein M9H77_06824 [Catharanthus roseus]|uniref:Uncharacterized protein n=1 Tax=Catharanthus roseus TaxID=4058 RepID=A0ACC0BT75_CATRO|nr:hypothetical protein M9H77_06824 [Catharanthus roseus]
MEIMMGMLTGEAAMEIDITPVGVKWVLVTSLLVLNYFPYDECYMQEHQGVVTRVKAKQLKSHKDQTEQEKVQGLNFDVQDFMKQYAKVLNKLEIEKLLWQMVGSIFGQAGKLPPMFGNVLTSALE